MSSKQSNIKLVNINKRTFRVPKSSLNKKDRNKSNFGELKIEQDENNMNSENIRNDISEKDIKDDNEIIEKLSNLELNNSKESNGELLKAFVPCDKDFRGLIIGKKGATKKKIITETGVKNIFIPSSRDNSDIIIEAEKAEELENAKKRIMEIIESAKKKVVVNERPTHFLSLPLIDSEFLKKTGELYEKIKDKEEDKAFINSILMPLKSIHLTLGVMVLKNEEEINKAIELLRSCSSKVYDILQTHSAILKISGLATMKGTIKKAKVVYCRVLEEQSYNLIMEACNYIVNKFEEAGYMSKDNHRDILFHATILNTTYSRKRFGVYDATELFEKYGSTDFGNVLISNISLCQMGTKSENGYKCLAKIALP